MEQIKMAPEVPAENPDYLATMAAAGSNAVNAGNTHGDEVPVKPEGVPDKFWDATKGQVNTEALLKSYTELEKMKGSKEAPQDTPAADPEKKPEEPPKDSLKIESVADAEKLVTSKGLDFKALATEYETAGILSEDTLKGLEDKGITREVVNQFLDGQKAIVNNLRATVFDTVGGEEKYSEMVRWAKEAMPKEEVEAYNRAINTSDVAMVKLLAAGLQQRYVAANGSPPKASVGGKTDNSGSATSGYKSRQQYVDAIKDPRYERDSAYRNEVMDKLKASNIF